jgi:hypothetical protein
MVGMERPRPVYITDEDGDATASDLGTGIGAVNETAPATDTASSGLNGRLQRIAQRITSLIALVPASLGTKAAASSFATTLDTEFKARIPAALGQAAAAASLPVVLASDQIVTAKTGVETASTPAAVTLVASTAKDLLAANAARIRATIYNPLATALFVRKATFAASPATVSAGGYDFVIAPGGHFISDPYEFAGGYNGICATAGNVNVSESI